MKSDMTFDLMVTSVLVCEVSSHRQMEQNLLVQAKATKML